MDLSARVRDYSSSALPQRRLGLYLASARALRMLSDRIAHPHSWNGRTCQSALTYESVGSSHESGLALIEMLEADARRESLVNAARDIYLGS